MIQKVSTSSVNKQNQQQTPPNFKGGPVDLLLSGLQACEANPMLNVTVLDLSTAIIPRTAIEAQTNPYAGLEAFRRESSGLVINCLIPGLVVAGIAKGLQGLVMGKGSDMSKCWANEETLGLVTDFWKDAPDAAVTVGERTFAQGHEAKAYNTIKNLLSKTYGVDGDKTVCLKDYSQLVENAAKEITEETLNPQPKKSFFERLEDKSALRKEVRKLKKAAKEAGQEYEKPMTAFEKLVATTNVEKNIKNTEHHPLDKKTGKEVCTYLDQGLDELHESLPKILRGLNHHQSLEKNKGLPIEKIAESFKKDATSLVKYKSLIGLFAVVIPLALAAQPINRWITAKTSGKTGAPIYKDFENAEDKKQTPQEKAALASQKLISVASIVGVALASIMKKPSIAMLKSITQFKGIFPSMDQARIVSTATFASRMMASQDKNDLREATFRDIATFCAFYFLGDYVKKGLASFIENVDPKLKKHNIKLVNDLDKLEPGKTRSLWKNIVHWTKNTAMKSANEIVVKAADGKIDKKLTEYVQHRRTFCQLGNIAFSLVALGLVIPKMYRKKTEQEHEKELKQTKTEQAQAA